MMYGETLKDIRDREKLNQKDIAKLLGISNTLYCDYENENQIMPIKYLNILANEFKVSLDFIFNFNSNSYYNISSLQINKNISGLRIKEFRKDSHLTQLELAKILNIGNGTIAEYERGNYIISTHSLYEICSKYKISADYLLGKIDSPKYLD